MNLPIPLFSKNIKLPIPNSKNNYLPIPESKIKPLMRHFEAA